MSLVAGNLLAVPIALGAAVIILLVHKMIRSSFGIHRVSLGALLALLGLMLVVIVVHEALHAIGFLLAGAVRSSVTFGVDLENLTVVAHCTTPVFAHSMRIALILPGLVLGLLPAIAGIGLDKPLLTIIGALGMAAAAGDVLALWRFREFPGHVLLKDHPTHIGCYVPRAGQSRPVA